MANATRAFRIQSSVTLGADQTWNIANAVTATNSGFGLNKGEDFGFNVPPAGFVLDMAGFTVTKTGAGMAGFGTGITVTSTVPGAEFDVDQGIMMFQSGGSRTTTVTDALTLNMNTGTRLQIAVESGLAAIGIAV
mgnify:CR=1 FL=1